MGYGTDWSNWFHILASTGTRVGSGPSSGVIEGVTLTRLQVLLLYEDQVCGEKGCVRNKAGDRIRPAIATTTVCVG